MKKLPSIFKNININPINNNKNKCIVKEDILNYLFTELPNPYDIKVEIKKKDKVILLVK